MLEEVNPLDIYLEYLAEGYREATFAFDGLADEHVWKRPADGLLSVGELAGHTAYWLAVRLAGEGGVAVPSLGDDGGVRLPDLANCKVTSLLIDHRFRYHPGTMAAAPSPEHLVMTAEQVCSELMRVHRETVAYLRELNPDLDSSPPGVKQSYRMFLKYLAFHVAYHTGQMYSVRHLLGEETPDN